MANIAFAISIIGVYAVMRLSTGRAPKFRKCIEFKGKTWMAGGHNAMRRKLISGAKVARKAELAALCSALPGKQTGGEICLVSNGWLVVMGRQPVFRTAMTGFTPNAGAGRRSSKCGRRFHLSSLLRKVAKKTRKICRYFTTKCQYLPSQSLQSCKNTNLVK